MLRKKVLRLVKKRYCDYGPTLVPEKLEEKHGLKLPAVCRKGKVNWRPFGNLKKIDRGNSKLWINLTFFQSPR